LFFLLSGCRDDLLPSKFIDRKDIIKQYKDNTKRFERVARYLKDDKNNIFIEKTDKKKFTIQKPGKEGLDIIEIDNEKVNEDIGYILNDLSFEYIYEEGTNGVFFVRQTSLRYASGIVYSKDGEKPDWGTIEEIEAIEDLWYWYKGY